MIEEPDPETAGEAQRQFAPVSSGREFGLSEETCIYIFFLKSADVL